SAPGKPQKLAFGAGGAGGAVARGQWDAEVSARGRGEGEGTSRCWPADAGRTMLAGSRGHRLAHPPQARPVGTPTPAHAGRARGQRRRARRVNQLSGVKSRLAMYSGRGAGAANGSVSVFSTLLNTRKMFERGNGVMLFPEPCMMLQSNQSAVPAGPVNWAIPYRCAIQVIASSLGTPTVCSFNEEAWLFSGV